MLIQQQQLFPIPSYSAFDLYDELVAQMDVMFEHNINGVDYEDMDEDPERIAAARDTFENKNGLPSSSTAYGIFMNSYGASVFAISGSPGHSDGVIVSDVRIHGLYKDPWEVPRIVLTKGPFNDIMDFTVCYTLCIHSLSLSLSLYIDIRSHF